MADPGVTQRLIDATATQARRRIRTPDPFIARLRDHGPIAVAHLEDLYGARATFADDVAAIFATAIDAHAERSPALIERDAVREVDPGWYRSHHVVGAWAYVDRFSDTLPGLIEHLDYLGELGIGYLHLMPLFARPPGPNDGGYAVSSYRRVHPRLGTMDDLRDVAAALHERGIALAVDLVFNHTADDHPWALAAKQGSPTDRACYLTFDTEAETVEYQRLLRQIFPDEKPGSFIYSPDLDRWVWSTFHSYQWDLDYRNPEVFRRMLAETLFLANVGIDVLRLDAVPFIWKELGTSCENLPEAHTIIRALNALVRIAAPATIFKSEAIVHPDDVRSYLGTDDPYGRECELSYHPLLMVEGWEALATGHTHLLRQSMATRFTIPQRTAWVNYVRSHDDIGWGFADEDAAAVGIDGFWHRAFLNRFYTGQEPGSFARGVPFQVNPTTGDARLSGATASLAGLEQALLRADDGAVELAIRRILLLHGLAIATPGMPLLDLGDEIGTLNDLTYVYDPARAHDSRWIHRPQFDWLRAERRHLPGSIEGRVFGPLTHMLRVRRTLPALAAGSRYLPHDVGNTHVYVAEIGEGELLLVANFTSELQHVTVPVEGTWRDALTSEPSHASFTLDAYQMMWLVPVETGTIPGGT